MVTANMTHIQGLRDKQKAAAVNGYAPQPAPSNAPVTGANPTGNQPVAGSQESHRAYIDKTMGGTFTDGSYASNNVNRYNSGEITYDQLKADSDRVGYEIPLQQQVQQTQQTQNATPQNPYDLIKSMYDNAYSSQAQKLKALRDGQLAGLAGQDTLVNDQAKAGLNANDVSSARQGTALREQMANLGIGASGDYISAQVGQDTATGQNAANINLDRSQRLEGITAQKNAINNNASADDLALLQKIMSERSGTTLGQFNNDRDFDLRRLAQEYSQDPNNPQNQGQQLQNQGQGIQNRLSQLQLENYPEQVKQQAAKYEQEIATGKMTLEAAEYNHKQLIDPNSAYNKAIALDLQMKQLEAANLPEMQRQELLKIKKQIADIGVTHYKPQTAAEIAYDQEKVNKIKAEILKIEGSTGETPDTPKPTKNELESEYYTNLDGMDEANLIKFFKDEKSNIIADLGKSGYDDLKAEYKIYD